MFRSKIASRAAALVVAALVIVGLSGCTSVVAGSATRAAGSVTSDGVDVDLLSTGNYPTKPATPYGDAGTVPVGTLLEGARLANYVTLPTDVDPALIESGFRSAVIIKNADAIDLIITGPVDAPTNDMVNAAKAHNFVVGFTTSRSTKEGAGDNLALLNAVLVFPDDAAAKAAATEMSAAEMVSWPQYPSKPQPIPGHPDAMGYTADMTTTMAASYTAHGRYVLYQWATAPTGDAGAALIGKALDQQVSLIDGFTPTDPAKLADLPIDPTGLLARTILVDPADATVNDNVVLEPDAALQYQTDPIRSAKLFDDLGVDAISVGKTNVYQTAQDDGGSQIVDSFSEEAVTTMGFEPASGVMGMPGVKCFSKTMPNASGGNPSGLFYCIGSAGKYGFEAISQQENDVHQMMGAEYLILTS